MNTTTVMQKKILHLEAEIKLLRESFTRPPDFRVDESNWEKIKPAVKKTRAKVFKKVYG